jgi:hypothetical protein
LDRALPVLHQQWDASFYAACESLAVAHVRVHRIADAVDALEHCSARKPPYWGLFSGGFWLKVKLQLATLYRELGRRDDAVVLERELLYYLAGADPDHPFLIDLRRLQ